VNRRYAGLLLILMLALLVAACATTSPRLAATRTALPPPPTVAALETAIPPTMTAAPTATLPPPPTSPPTATLPPPPLRAAIIGDFGEGNQAEADVAALVHSWQPDIILTVGDNNYPVGAAETIDDRIGRFYADYIGDYRGEHGPGAPVNRFFPTLGNHDWYQTDAQPYLDYFTLPGNERYYDFVWGPVHFFALNSDSNEPDGVNAGSVQAQWLQAGLAASTAPWQVVYMHAPPYSSGYHGSITWTRWPYRAWGADVVLAGHDHSYERLFVDGLPYLVNGLGGGPIYAFNLIENGSQVRYNEDYGAQLLTATEDALIFEFYNRRGELIDQFQIPAAP
jgi:hypothetical protein